MQTIVELQNVDKVYKMGEVRFPALKDISLKIKKAEKVAIMGPSGCGKSTLLNLIGCLDRPTRGKILIDDKDISKLNDDELAEIRREKVGFVFQFFHLVPSLTSLENVSLPMTFQGIPKQEREKKAKDLLEMVDLGKRLNHKQSQLSGGERQRVAIARAMANDPQMILADEPTGNLDSKTGEDIISILLKLNKEHGITLIVVTHDPDIANHVERIIRLKDGKIIKDAQNV